MRGRADTQQIPASSQKGAQKQERSQQETAPVMTADEHFETALTLLNSEKWQEAIDALSSARLLYQNADNIQQARICLLYTNLARIQLAETNISSTIRGSIAGSPLPPAMFERKGDVLHNIGDVHSALGQDNRALKAYEHALTIRTTLSDLVKQASTLRAIGVLYQTKGDSAQSKQSFQEALALVEESSSDEAGTQLLLQLYSDLGAIYTDQQAHEVALKLYNQKLELLRREETASSTIAPGSDSSPVLFRSNDIRTQEGNTLREIGKVYEAMGDPESALFLYREALTIGIETANLVLEARSLDSTARAYRDLANYEEALEALNQAVALWIDLEEAANQATTLRSIGRTHFIAGNFDQAVGSFTQSLTVWRDLNNPIQANQTLSELGRLYRETEQFDAALNIFQEIMLFAEEENDNLLLAMSLKNIGLIQREAGLYDDALESSTQALTLWRQMEDAAQASESLREVGQTQIRRQQFGAALDAYDEAKQIAQELSDSRLLAKLLEDIGAAHRDNGQYESARLSFDEAIALWQTLGSLTDEANVLRKIGRVHVLLGQYEAAVQTYDEALVIAQQLGDLELETRIFVDLDVLYARQLRENERRLAALPATVEDNGITSPIQGESIGGRVRIKGIATHPNFQKWQLDLLLFGDEQQATSVAWNDVRADKRNGTLTNMDSTPYPDGEHILRLRVVRDGANYNEYFTPVTIDNSTTVFEPNGLTGPAANAVLSGEVRIEGVAFHTDFRRWELDLLVAGDESQRHTHPAVARCEK
ncbi:tetratricopeptide repeat protein [Chloroflexi bacterium TSY]|nr:tetratricopeptide repeat protein [Chloroflexi bacterium TSY]